MKIGLMSDTHSHLDPKVLSYFKDVDEVWHAGDVGDIDVIDSIREHKPVRAVFGNIDDHIVRLDLPEMKRFTLEGVRVLMIHIAGRPGKYTEQARLEIQKAPVDLFICGHSHILLVQKDPKYGFIHMNPGACGVHGFHKVKTLLRFELNNGKIENLEAIEIGPRAKVSKD
jgi:uncharacterized protein